MKTSRITNVILCEKKVSALRHLKDHIKTVHDGWKDHKCDICNKNFALERKLKEHFKNHSRR